jgi:hypothetical protein
MGSRSFFALGLVVSSLAAGVAAAPAAAQARRAVVAPAVIVQTAPPPSYGPRFRFGMSLNGGGLIGDAEGGFAGLSLRAGIQIIDELAIYYQAHGLFGAFVSQRESGAVLATMWNQILFEADIGGVLMLGAGPSLDVFAGCASTADGSGCGSGGPFFGIDGRVALALGGSGPGARGAFVVSADFHPTILPNGVLMAFVLGLGGEIH